MRFCLVLLLACIASSLAQQTVSVSVSPAQTLESATDTITFNVTRVGTTGSAVDVFLALSGTATFGADYNLNSGAVFTSDGSSGNLTMAGGQLFQLVTFDVVDDLFIEGNETIIFSLISDVNYAINSPTVEVLIVENDFAEVTIDVSASPVVEGTDASVTFTVRRSGDTSLPLTVPFSVNGTADIDSDYSLTSGPSAFNSTTGDGEVLFAPAVNSVDILFAIDDNSLGEEDKNIIVQVFEDGVSPYVTFSANDTASTTIQDDDLPTIYLTASNTTVPESFSSDVIYTFTREASDIDTAPLDVSFLLSGSAVRGVDYNISSSFFASSFVNQTEGVIIFLPSNKSIDVAITILDNAITDGTRTLSIEIVASPLNYTLGTNGTVDLDITNDDITVLLSVDPSSVLEDSGNPLVYNFTRIGSTSGNLTVGFAIGGTAFSSDFETSGDTTFGSTSGTVTILDGDADAFISVTPNNDADIESDETVSLTLSPSLNYIVETSGAVTGTIENDDLNEVTLALSPTRVFEDSLTPFVYTFSRLGDSSSLLTVNFDVGGTAGLSGVGGTDYSEVGAQTFSSNSGTIRILPGSTTASLVLTPIVDSAFEGNETIVITLRSGTGYSIGTPQGVTATIVNDDAGTNSVSVVAAPLDVFENPLTPIIVTFERAGDTSGALIAQFIVGGTAQLGVDYNVIGANLFTDTEGEVLFVPSSRSAVIELVPTDNTLVSDIRTIILTLIPTTGYVVLPGQETITATIQDDDVVTIDTLEPVVTSATGFVYVALRLDESIASRSRAQIDADLVAAELRVEISNFLKISSKYVDVYEVYLLNAEIRIFTVPSGESAIDLAETLVLAVNGRNPELFGTILYSAQAFEVAATFADPPSFNQDFGVDQQFLDDLIGASPPTPYSFFYYYAEESTASAIAVSSVIVCVVALLNIFIL